jgi:YfdX protein
MKKATRAKRAITSLLIASSVGLCQPQMLLAAEQPTARKTEASKQTVEKTTDKRKAIVSEAVSTLRETQDALKALDEGKNKDALAALERATGKLEIVLARDPKAALVPLDVKVATSNLYAPLDAIKNARQEAQRLLNAGRVQEARALLMHLGSESVISTTNLPLATYPGAIKRAAKLIDENKPAEAKEVLQTALNTLVITDVVVPLPVVDAKLSLQRAEELAKIKNRTAAQNKELSDLVGSADSDIQRAEALGYGTKSDFDSFHKQIAEIRQKTSNGKFGIGFFDQIKNYLESMNRNSQHKVVAQNK